MKEASGHRTDEPLQLPRYGRRRALAGSFGVFAGTGLIWAGITTLAPNFFASSDSPFAYLVVVIAVLLLFGGLIAGQIRAVKSWFTSLLETDGVSGRSVNRLRWAVWICILIGLLTGISIFLFTQLVWMPQVREIVGEG